MFHGTLLRFLFTYFVLTFRRTYEFDKYSDDTDTDPIRAESLQRFSSVTGTFYTCNFTLMFKYNLQA